MKVTITQFMRPNGRQVEHSVEVPDELRANYEALRKCGCRLTAEVLMTGAVSQAVEHEDGDFLIEITGNGPEVQDALVKMLREFNETSFQEWLRAVNA